MRFSFLLPVFLLHGFTSPRNLSVEDFKESKSDTSFTHIIDGKVTEWSPASFETDMLTEIKYAKDNDAQNLYLALIIPSTRIQMKIMRQGMELYIDIKDKKKAKQGIEFPVKRDQTTENTMTSPRSQRDEENPGKETPEQKKARFKAMRASMTLNLVSMKVFGFSEDKSEEQGLIMPGSANVAFAWDSTETMCIEYKIPISLLGASSSLSQKEITLGWKLNGFQMSSNNSSSGESSQGGGRHGGGGGRHGGGGGGGGYHNQGEASNQQDIQNLMKDQSFWTKYTFK